MPICRQHTLCYIRFAAAADAPLHAASAAMSAIDAAMRSATPPSAFHYDAQRCMPLDVSLSSLRQPPPFIHDYFRLFRFAPMLIRCCAYFAA